MPFVNLLYHNKAYTWGLELPNLYPFLDKKEVLGGNSLLILALGIKDSGNPKIGAF